MGLSSLSLALLYSNSSRFFSFTPPQFSLKWMFMKSHRFWSKIQTWSDSFWLLSVFDFQTSPLFFILFFFLQCEMGPNQILHFVDHNKKSKKYYDSNAVRAFECRPSWFKACTHRATSVPSEAIYQNRPLLGIWSPQLEFQQLFIYRNLWYFLIYSVLLFAHKKSDFDKCLFSC